MNKTKIPTIERQIEVSAMYKKEINQLRQAIRNNESRIRVFIRVNNELRELSLERELECVCLKEDIGNLEKRISEILNSKPIRYSNKIKKMLKRSIIQ